MRNSVSFVTCKYIPRETQELNKGHFNNKKDRIDYEIPEKIGQNKSAYETSLIFSSSIEFQFNSGFWLLATSCEESLRSRLSEVTFREDTHLFHFFQVVCLEQAGGNAFSKIAGNHLVCICILTYVVEQNHQVLQELNIWLRKCVDHPKEQHEGNLVTITVYLH